MNTWLSVLCNRLDLFGSCCINCVFEFSFSPWCFVLISDSHDRRGGGACVLPLETKNGKLNFLFFSAFLEVFILFWIGEVQLRIRVELQKHTLQNNQGDCHG